MQATATQPFNPSAISTKIPGPFPRIRNAFVAPMFPHKIGKGYSNPFIKVVKEVNGVRVKNLRHMVELLRDCKEKYTTISFNDKGSETIVFNHLDALSATEDVLNDNGIRQRASDDIAPLWSAKPVAASQP